MGTVVVLGKTTCDASCQNTKMLLAVLLAHKAARLLQRAAASLQCKMEGNGALLDAVTRVMIVYDELPCVGYWVAVCRLRNSGFHEFQAVLYNNGDIHKETSWIL